MTRYLPGDLKARYHIATGPRHVQVVELCGYVSTDDVRMAIVIRELVDNEICVVRLLKTDGSIYEAQGVETGLSDQESGEKYAMEYVQ